MDKPDSSEVEHSNSTDDTKKDLLKREDSMELLEQHIFLIEDDIQSLKDNRPKLENEIKKFEVLIKNLTKSLGSTEQNLMAAKFKLQEANKCISKKEKLLVQLSKDCNEKTHSQSKTNDPNFPKPNKLKE